MTTHTEDALQQLSKLIKQCIENNEYEFQIAHYMAYEAFPKSDSSFDVG